MSRPVDSRIIATRMESLWADVTISRSMCPQGRWDNWVPFLIRSMEAAAGNKNIGPIASSTMYCYGASGADLVNPYPRRTK